MVFGVLRGRRPAFLAFPAVQYRAVDQADRRDLLVVFDPPREANHLLASHPLHHPLWALDSSTDLAVVVLDEPSPVVELPRTHGARNSDDAAQAVDGRDPDLHRLAG